MCFRCLSLLGLFAFVAGCNVQTGISPIEPVIQISSDRDFGFVGTWIPTPNPELPPDVDSFEMTIKRDGSYSGSLIDVGRKTDNELTFSFRTHEISKDDPHAIIEFEAKGIDTIVYRRLAIAAVIDGNLCVWTIDGRQIGERLYNDGVAAVLEHFPLTTTVRCDSKKLLDSLAKHSGEIIGTAQVFKRKPEIGR